jgi:hypothetical protein
LCVAVRPDPIPNSVVKRFSGDNNASARLREDSSLPDLIKPTLKVGFLFIMPRSQIFEPAGLPDAGVTWKFPPDRVPEWARSNPWPTEAFSTRTSEELNRRFGLFDIGSWIPTCAFPNYPPNERIKASYAFALTNRFSERAIIPLAEIVIRFGHFVAVPAKDLVVPENPMGADFDIIDRARRDGYIHLSVNSGIVLAELSTKFGEVYDPANLRRLVSDTSMPMLDQE